MQEAEKKGSCREELGKDVFFERAHKYIAKYDCLHSDPYGD